MEKSCENCRCQYSVDYCFDCHDFDRYLPDYQTLESELAKANKLIIEQIEQLAQERDYSHKIQCQIFSRYAELFANYAFVDHETAVELMAGEIQVLRKELEQYKEALKTIKTYSSGPIITIGGPDEEDGFPEGSVYGYNLAIEQIVNEVINPLLGESKPKEDDDD